MDMGWMEAEVCVRALSYYQLELPTLCSWVRAVFVECQRRVFTEYGAVKIPSDESSRFRRPTRPVAKLGTDRTV